MKSLNAFAITKLSEISHVIGPLKYLYIFETCRLERPHMDKYLKAFFIFHMFSIEYENHQSICY